MTSLDLDLAAPIVTEQEPRRREPGGLPLLGHILAIKGDPLGFALRMMQDHGDIAEFDLALNQRVVMLNHPRHIRHVLQDNRLNYEKSKYVAFLEPILGGGILLAEGDCWKKQRQTAVQGFKGHCLKYMVRDMTWAVDQMIGRWRLHQAAGEPIPMLPEMMRVTLDVVFRALLGVRLENEHPDIYNSLTTILRTAEERIWSFVQPPYWVPTPANFRVKAGLRRLHEIVDRVIDERHRLGRRREDLLQIFIDSYAPHGPDREARIRLRNQLKTIVLAGHDTASNGMAWTFYLLSKHPDVYRRVKEEVDRVLGDRIPTFEDIENLKYSRMVFKESLRVYPPIWTFSRQAVEDDQIVDIDVRKGTTVMIAPYAIHRRPDFYTNPEGFDPERFDPDRADQPDRYAYLPFGGGPRTCLGNRFAEIESMIILSMVVQNFRLDLVPGQKVEAEPVITLRHKNDVYFTLTEAA